MNKNVKIFTYIFAVFVIVLGIYLKISSGKIEADKLEVNTQIRPVINFSGFYTVTSCVNKYISYKNQKDIGSMLDVLSAEYKKTNKIDRSNVLEKMTTKNDNTVFRAKKMLYAQYNEQTYIYYVYGLEGEDNSSLDKEIDERQLKEVYYTVYIDDEEKIFSIAPYDGKIFKSGEL